jgi:hypothetical protein
MFLSKWDDGSDFRIHAYNQGKFLVKLRKGVEMLVEDPVKQGEARLASPDHGPRLRTDSTDAEGLPIGEFASMVDAAQAGMSVDGPAVRQQQ